MRNILISLSIFSLLFFPTLATAFNEPIYVTHHLDTTECETTPGYYHCSLRGATLKANLDEGIDIIVIPTDTYTLTLNDPINNGTFGYSGSLSISDSVILIAEDGPGTVTIQWPDDAEKSKRHRLIKMHYSAKYVQLSGLTFKNGYSESRGGAIFAEVPDLELLITDSLFINNESESEGGAIYWASDPMINSIPESLTIMDSEFDGNQSNIAFGGAISMHTDNKNNRIQDTVFKNNYANKGGALSMTFKNDANPLGSVDLIRTNFANNSSTNGGGAITCLRSQLNISDSSFSQNTTDIAGGAIFLQCDLSMSESSLTDNHAGTLGGGIFFASFIETVIDIYQSHFISNQSESKGGGLYLKSQKVDKITIRETDFRGNAVTEGEGGGLYYDGKNEGSLTISQSNLTNNHSDFGGGLAMSVTGNKEMNINESTFHRNTADQSGGGAWVELKKDSNLLEISKSSFTYNNAYTEDTETPGGGGGLLIKSDPEDPQGRGVLVVNSTFSGNGTATNGGGIYHQGELLGLVHVTLSNNIAKTGGGLMNHSDAPENSETLLMNTMIVKNHNFDNNFSDCSGSAIHSLGGNMDSDISCQLKEDIDLIGIENPMLGPLGYYGGTTRSHRLEKSSPAVNTGVDTNMGIVSDQRGEDRPCGPKVDMGAYEYCTLNDEQLP